jgi:hypothetical protein
LPLFIDFHGFNNQQIRIWRSPASKIVVVCRFSPLNINFVLSNRMKTASDHLEWIDYEHEKWRSFTKLNLGRIGIFHFEISDSFFWIIFNQLLETSNSHLLSLYASIMKILKTISFFCKSYAGWWRQSDWKYLTFKKLKILSLV